MPVWWRLLAAHRGSAGPRLWPCRVLDPGCRDRPTSASWPPAWWRHSALTAARLGCECSGECCVSVPKPICRTDFRRAGGAFGRLTAARVYSILQKPVIPLSGIEDVVHGATRGRHPWQLLSGCAVRVIASETVWLKSRRIFGLNRLHCQSLLRSACWCMGKKGEVATSDQTGRAASQSQNPVRHRGPGDRETSHNE